MKLQPIVYVTDMAASVRWYTNLLQTEPDASSAHWTSFGVSGGNLALHLTESALGPGGVELSLVADEPLETIAERVEPTRGIADEAFGRSLIVTDPDGTGIQVNEHDPSLWS